jgi:hypothetical protein
MYGPKHAFEQSSHVGIQFEVKSQDGALKSQLSKGS